jgi:competence protein ComEA
MFDPDRRHLIAYAAAAAVLVVIGLQLLGSQSGRAPAPAISMAAPPSPGATKAKAPAHSIWVDVAGAVRRPGLYRLSAGSRAAAAIERAGGPLRRAELAAVNQAAKLADGQQIVVPLRGPGAAGATAAPVSASSAATAVRSTISGAGGAGPGPASGAKLSLGSATSAQLEELEGIGPALAGRIIAYRDAHGGFRSVDELQEVDGIGDKRLQSLRGSVQP